MHFSCILIECNTWEVKILYITFLNCFLEWNNISNSQLTHIKSYLIRLLFDDFFLLFNKNHMHDLIFSNIDMNEKSSIKPRKTSLIVSNHDDLIQFPWKTKSTYICVYVQRHVRTYIILMDWTMIRTHYFSVTFFFEGVGIFINKYMYIAQLKTLRMHPITIKKTKKIHQKLLHFS